MTENELTGLLEAELQRLRMSDLGRRITALETLLGGATNNHTEPAEEPSPADARVTRGPRVSEPKLRAVRDYLEHKGEVRQVQIAKALDENSGTVSLALRQLQAQGEAEDTGRVIQKSKLWRFIGERQRTVRVEPGVGLSEGRKR